MAESQSNSSRVHQIVVEFIRLLPDITVSPVCTTEFNHQPQLVNPPHRRKHRHQLVFKAVPKERQLVRTPVSVL